MNVRSSWNPLIRLDGISKRLNHIFSHRDDQAMGDDNELMTVPDWYPPVDVLETDYEFCLKVDVPGVSKDKVRVTIDDAVLVIQGERQREVSNTGHKIHRLERPYGRFIRSFTLPESMEAGSVRADFRDGVLSVHLPKFARANARLIDVKAA